MAISSRGEGGVGGGSRGMSSGGGISRMIKKVAKPKKSTSNGVVRNANRPKTGDYVVPGKASKNVMPKLGKTNGGSTQISENVKIKDTKSPSGKTMVRGGASQVMNQNARLSKPLTKAEAKANARGLKAAQGKLSKGNAKRMYDKDKIEMIMKYNPGDSKADAIRWSSHPGHASQKSNARLQKGKWTSEKKIAKYQKAEIKDFRKPKK